MKEYVCELCGAQFQLDQGVYDGHYIPRYQFTICQTCWDGNWDGYTPRLDERIIAHLRAKGIPEPARNAKGWFPRE